MPRTRRPLADRPILVALALVLLAPAPLARQATTGAREMGAGIGASPQEPDSADRARALHVLNRLAYGPRPGDVARVLALGPEQFIERQLHPESIPDTALERRLARFEVLRLAPGELARVVLAEQRARQRDPRPPGPSRARRLAAELQQVALERAVLSQRQLYEVMVDFWTNHFNVFLAKGAGRFLLPDYLEHTIRPRALGRLEDLLLAVAHSPAMLFYLDNAQSVAPGAEPPQPRRLAARLRGSRADGRADSLLARLDRRRPRGINENYARELLELHTLGVDGGYTQQDVIAVARILTGWSMTSPEQGDVRFVFRDWAHDYGPKTVLGHAFPAGRGEDEGIALLRLLARHPATARHVSAKLCARFVADDPPAGCVDAATGAWERSGGDIREVLRAIFHCPDFWAPGHRGAKIKTPLEFVASAVRAVGGEPDSTLALAQVVARLGQPLFLAQPPTGYPETQAAWVNAGALLERLRVATALAAGRLPGVAVHWERLLSPATGAGELPQRVNQLILNGAASPRTLEVMRQQIAGLDPEAARSLAVGLALGSPEFQRQ